MSEENAIVLAGILSFALILLLGPATIRYLYRLKFGQQIRDAGPSAHKKKGGTPTMGGVLIILAISVSSLFVTDSYSALPYALFVVVGFGLIGLIDDFIIVATKRSLGLKARHKLVGQILVAMVLALYVTGEPRLGPSLLIPFTGTVVQLPTWLFLILATTTVVGAANAVNFTDGLDGLAAGASAVAMVVYAIIAYALGSTDLAILAAAVTGACLGFCWFNAYPAQVFMGDTGSLALGGALGAIAVLTATELHLCIIGGLFVVETLSVILQVSYFRLTGGKRIFKMAPLHHHYELLGWPESKIVTRFWLAAMVFGVLGLLTI
ncbi:MAG: phospho-N-acetylmuramoyl-pentapeptide-transferase [Limnochordia bacterium]